MKKLVCSLTLFTLMIVNNSYAQNFEISGQNIIRSKYVGPDGVQFYNRPVAQGNVSFVHKSGLFFDLWYSFGSDFKWSKDWDDEIDYTIGWEGKISWIKLNASLSYFDDFKIFNYSHNDVVRTYIQANLPKKISPKMKSSLFVNYTNFSIPDKKTPFEGGNLYAIGVDGEIIISSKSKIVPLIQYSWNDGALEAEKGSLMKYSSILNWEVSEHITWNVCEVTLYVPFKGREIDNELVLGTGLSWKL